MSLIEEDLRNERRRGRPRVVQPATLLVPAKNNSHFCCVFFWFSVLLEVQTIPLYFFLTDGL